MTNDDWIRLTTYLQGRFGEVNARLDSVDAKINTQLNLLTTLAGRQSDHEIEDAARDMQLTRHEGWIRQLAAKLDIDLKS